MSLLARRQRDHEEQRERALIEIRERVVAAMPHLPTLGSSPIGEAVDEALDQLRANGNHLAGELADVQRLWILYAKRRLIDHGRTLETKRRERTPVDEHVKALAASATSEPAGDERDWWRVREILGRFRGDERRFAEAWVDQVQNGQRQPRGLGQTLGWTSAKTENVSRRVRAQMAGFIDQRASGAICNTRKATLDAFITATAAENSTAAFDEQRGEAMLIHLMGCEDCASAWRARRRTLGVRFPAFLALPIGRVATAIRAKLAGLAGSAHGATLSLRQRLGLGGGTGAVTGGGAVALSGKAAAICTAVVCAASAAGGVVVEAVPSILPATLRASRQTPRHAAPHRSQHAQPAQPAAKLASYTPPANAPVQTAATVPHVVKPKKSASTFDPTYTPGDLTPASSQQASPAGSSASRTATTATAASTSQRSAGAPATHSQTPSATANQPSCTPGDLAC